MKFAKELEQDLVPEWRIKYLNYKAGKKYVKGVARAINRANTGVGRKSENLPRHEVPSFFYSPFSRHQRSAELRSGRFDEGDSLTSAPAPVGRTPRSERGAVPTLGEQESLTRLSRNRSNYGSTSVTPVNDTNLTRLDSRQTTFELPGPAIQEPLERDEGAHSSRGSMMTRLTPQRSASAGSPAIMRPQVATLPRSGLSSQPAPSPGGLRRLFSHDQRLDRTESAKIGHAMETIDTVRQREREFFGFLDNELEKVETFYRQKETQAGARLEALREQLHEMRNRRSQEIAELRRRKEQANGAGNGHMGSSSGVDQHNKWINPITSKLFKPGANSKALAKMPQTPRVGPNAIDATRDYIRRPHEHEVPYRTAKRKLKLALQEFYRGLELLKAYAILNRTAFRKLNKKYDKAVNARPPLRYLNEKVSKSWFVTSEVVDGHIRAVEDLYARYFEKGNHKMAAGKLRRMTRRPGDESGIAFRNGILIGVGAVLTIEAATYGGELLFDPDPMVRLQTSYLLQIYGGYFLMLTLFAYFCIDCYFWTANKINYQFIFEFDPRHQLDWRQLASYPSFFLFLFGLIAWLNFTRYGDSELWLYFPVILIGVSLIIILLPLPIFWHRSRRWFAYSHWRLFFAGLYPVEFRDFFLGDMYCSLTYATSNAELFFCLYAHHWNNPPQCNSNHSRLMGFLMTLPPIWRALQCIRRYYDTRNVFPHLVNCGKYFMTILAGVFLSLYRLSNTHTNLALFIFFSSANGIYTSVWDLFMDFSLLQANSRHPFLRDILGLKGHRWRYYLIMILDPILRFGWIFYAIFTHNTQHSSIVSFLVSFSEVTRRGMWALLRVENEHCTNVGQYKASRDVPLPYDIHHETLLERPSLEDTTQNATQNTTQKTSPKASNEGISQDQTATGTQSSPVRATPIEEGGLRRRRKSEAVGAKSIRGIMASAHRQDFEKKRKPHAEEAASKLGSESADDIRSEEDEEDEDEDDSGSMIEERLEVQRVHGLVRGNDSDDER
ncbi:EXS-domain-containing protein [Xylariaceae sp. FL1019]|nr:EXS-domain-containing protein [Xylariaceae sp. FL1019]